MKLSQDKMYVHFCHDNNNVPDYVFGIIMSLIFKGIMVMYRKERKLLSKQWDPTSWK